MDKKLIIFDYNGTLVNTPFKDGQPLHILPNRVSMLQSLREVGIQIAVATNQAGPLWLTATNKPQFPSLHEVANELIRMRRELQCEQDRWYVSLYDSRAMAILKAQYEQQKLIEPALILEQLQYEMTHIFHANQCIAGIEKDWRKPEPGMLRRACIDSGVEAYEAMYIGDLDDDARAAVAAGMDFAWADGFFGMRTKEKQGES